MTIRAKNRVAVVAIVVSIVALVVTLLPMIASSNPEVVREVTS